MIDITLLIDSRGRYRTISLFKELSDGETALYTLSEQDSDLPSAYKIYMKHDTEYDAAIELVGSWNHWNRLLESPKFSEYVNEWRKEKLEQIKSRAIKTLIMTAEQGDISAAKWLAEQKYLKLNKKVSKLINEDLKNNELISGELVNLITAKSK